jgi:hypothetical protein
MLQLKEGNIECTPEVVSKAELELYCMVSMDGGWLPRVPLIRQALNDISFV